MKLVSKLKIEGRIRFDTAFHIGSGEGGGGGSDMGVLLDYTGGPILPGSSLKGVFRSTAESIAEHFRLKTCFLDRTQDWCSGANEKLARKKLEELSRANAEGIDRILSESLCDTCLLFGSLLANGKLRFSDANVLTWAGALEIRDGVGIDRDSGTSVHGVKYDYEVVPAGAAFAFSLVAENLTARERALVYAVIKEWERGFRLGGMTSRGFGSATLHEVVTREVDFTDPKQRVDYLVGGNMPEVASETMQQSIGEALGVDNA